MATKAKKNLAMTDDMSDKEARAKALKTAISQLERDYGAGTIMKLGENTHMAVGTRHGASTENTKQSSRDAPWCVH